MSVKPFTAREARERLVVALGAPTTLTGETITDEEIRELRDTPRVYEDENPDLIALLCKRALEQVPSNAEAVYHRMRTRARERCAEILNARRTAEIRSGRE